MNESLYCSALARDKAYDAFSHFATLFCRGIFILLNTEASFVFEARESELDNLIIKLRDKYPANIFSPQLNDLSRFILIQKTLSK